MALTARHRGSAVFVAIMATALSVALASAGYATSFAPQATLTASDEIGKSLRGSAVALSRDGNTALVGGPQDNGGIGAAWVFVRKHGEWTEQAKLTGGGEVGRGEFGTTVSLSSDGKTALIGGPNDGGGSGAAWVFSRTGSRWTQRAQKLTGRGANGICSTHEEEAACAPGYVGFGQSVALSSDGGTALIGGPGDHHRIGAAWVFVRMGSDWSQQGEKLRGGGEQNLDVDFGPEGGGEFEYVFVGGEFGGAVALSAQGNTALIGGPSDSTEFDASGAPGTVATGGTSVTSSSP